MSGITFALDYDGTVTSEPEIFLTFVKELRAKGNKVFIVTMRYPSECETILQSFKDNVDGIIATSRGPKLDAIGRLGLKMDIWIDDNPRAIFESADQIWGKASPEGQIIIEVHGN